MVDGAEVAKAKSLKVSFTQGGVPIKIESSEKAVTSPELAYVRSGKVDYRNLTRGWISGIGANAALTDSGKSLMRLLTYPD